MNQVPGHAIKYLVLNFYIMKVYLIVTVLFAMLVSSCGEPQSSIENTEVYNANRISVCGKTTTDSFSEATLTLLSADEEIKVGQNIFKYQVNSYNLKDQSPSVKIHSLANSHKGQHIHFIVDNAPYQAKYEPAFEAVLSSGSHLVLAFLSRSYHESVKHENAYVLKQYQLDSTAPLANIEKDPLLFYSRPKGEYSLDNGDQILLDFYLVNTALSEKGYKVKVLLDGQIFTVDKWRPYIIKGLGAGEHQISISLIYEYGELVPGPFNYSGLRKFNIKKL